MAIPEYSGSAADDFDHYVRNYSADALLRRLSHELITAEKLQYMKDRFCQGLEAAILRNPSE